MNLSPMEQVKARIESMRITNPDSNQLCKLLDMVEAFVKEEKELDKQCERITDSGAWD